MRLKSILPVRFVTAAAVLVWLSVSCNRTEEIFVPSSARMEVVEYCPAPGQFINKDEGCRTMEEAVAWAQDRLDRRQFVSLGAFGGYIVVRSGEEIPDGEGNDFSIFCNAFEGGSEPGAVWVSSNGMSWYQLEGDEAEEKGVSITYFRNEDGEPGDIRWRDSDGNEGVIRHLAGYHAQQYFPEWVPGASHVWTGTRIPDKSWKDEAGIWHSGNYGGGYADNWAEDWSVQGGIARNGFDISRAVDAQGRRVELDAIRYIKVQTAVMTAISSPTGEMSTEIMGFGR